MIGDRHAHGTPQAYSTPQAGTGRTLLLLRHAKSSWDDPDLTDKERPLNARGRKAAIAMAPLIAGWHPDHIVCSTAQRTRETLQPIIAALPGEVDIHLTDALYEAGEAAYWRCLRSLPDTAACALIIAHNPTLEDLTHNLLGQADPARLARIAAKFPTGTLVAMHCPIRRWSDLSPGANVLIDIVRPADLPAAT